ncbi:ewing's tumor-associated antigen 1 isoform X2 [Vanacampus margaritifer]
MRSVDQPAASARQDGGTFKVPSERYRRCPNMAGMNVNRLKSAVGRRRAREGDREFKTPTRPGPSRGFGAAGGAESPHDLDAHHEIIWDATSPQRLGKRAKKHAAGAVSISDIVSRIAPEHGRPEVSEPTLQQWIGDSAGIPCTPDIGRPKSRRKSPRSNDVDHLLRLAKQFDLNLLGPDDQEEASADEHLWSAEDDLWGPEDDRDFLFAETARQASAAATEDVPATPRADFADDWADDDLLDDSLLVEMTQNPENFCAPQHCSTQMAPPTSFAVSQSDEKRTLEKLAKCSDVPPPANFQAAGKDPTATHDDLDAIFSLEPLWDDPDDDEMLRELCEDVENRIGAKAAGKDSSGGLRAVAVTTAPAYSLPQRRPAQQFTFKRPGQPVSMATKRLKSLATNCPVAMVTSKPLSMATNQLSSLATNHPVPVVTNRPVSMATHHPVPMATSKAAVKKCSALEIERKKQQAVERRRRRLQEVQNVQ